MGTNFFSHLCFLPKLTTTETCCQYYRSYWTEHFEGSGGEQVAQYPKGGVEHPTA